MDWKQLFLTAEGRIGRKDFWIGFAIIFVASMVLNIIPILGQIIGLLLIWPQICIHAKRLHDMGRTGWLMVIPFALTLVCAIIAATIVGAGIVGAMVLGSADADMAAASSAMAGVGGAAAIMVLPMLVGLAFLLWVGLTPTQIGENQFGAQPVGDMWRGAPAPADPAASAPPAAPPASPPPTPPQGPLIEP